MRKFSRSLLWAGLVAAGAVACGDDVTITPPPPPPPPPTPTVHSISVAPTGITLAHPTTQQMTAAVNADAGVATTVTWSAAPATVATISASGLLTTVGNGNVAVQACSTVVTSVCGVATITVSTNPSTVTQVTVTPAAATITRPATGSTTLQLSAAVTGANNPSQTVTWSVATPGLGATVSVSNTGLVTVTSAAAGGTVNISACSTVAGFTNVCGFSALTIAIPAPTTIQIVSITTGATFIPVNINAVVGQIEFTINLDPGANTVAGVDVLIDGVVAATQNFAALEWETARAKALAEREAGNENANVNLVLSVNTAEYDCIAQASTACTGATTYKNGPRAVSARARLANSSPVATQVTTLIFANANGAHFKSFTTTGTTANALSAAGLRYDRGALSGTFVAVIYNAGQSIVSANVTFGNLGCDASGIGPRTVAAVAPTSGTDWTFTMAQTGTAGAGNVNAYEFNGCAPFNPIGESIYVTATDNNGDQLFAPGSAPLNVNSVVALRLDNRAPSGGGQGGAFAGVPYLNFDDPGGVTAAGNGPNGRTGWWMNDGVMATALTPSGVASASALTTSDNLVCHNATGGTLANCPGGGAATNSLDFGVGTGTTFGVTYEFHAAAVTVTSSGSFTTAAAAASNTTLAPLGESVTNQSFCGVGQAVDALGNKTLANATGSTSTTCKTLSGLAGGRNIITFGDDFTEPTAAWAGGSIAEGGRIAVSPIGAEFIAAVVDPGAPATASGIQNVTGPRWLLVRTRADGVSNRTAADASTTATSPTNTGAPACAAGFCATAIAGVATTAGSAAYRFARFIIRDAAGNSSTEISRSAVMDATASLVNTPAVPATITGSFPVSALGSDNLDLRDYIYDAGYGNAGCPMAGAFAYITACVIRLNNPALALNTFPPIPTTLLNTNVALNHTVNVGLVLQATNGTDNPVAYAAAAGNALDRVIINVRDQTQAAYTAMTTAGIFGNITAPAAGFAAFGGPNTFAPPVDPITGAPDVTNTSLCALAAASGGCAVGAPAGTNFASTVLTATANGATSVFNNPFSRIDFYCDNGAGLLNLLGSTSSFSLNDNGAIRTWSASIAVTAANMFALCGGVAGGAPGASITPPVFAFGVSVAGTVALVSQTLTAITVNP